MSPKTIQPSPEFVAWAESHRCAICNAPASRIESTMIEEHRTLRKEYRYLATIPAPAEHWQTDHVGGTDRVEIECENGHILSGTHTKFNP